MNLDISSKIKNFILPNLVFFLCFFLLGLLLFKNPFSERNLIANLEPYPDTFHYINPAIHFFENLDFKLSTGGTFINPTVAPLYSVLLVPFFLFSHDPRMFYFANLIVSFSSVFFLYLILKKIIKRQILMVLPLFLFTSNYFIYWVPTLAMAENLILFLFLAGTYLLISEDSFRNKLFAGFVGGAFFVTKTADFPITALYFLFYLIKIFRSRKTQFIVKLRSFASFFLVFLFLSSLFLVYETFHGVSFKIFWNLFFGSLFGQVARSDGKLILAGAKFSWFSLNYFSNNFPQYLSSIFGRSVRFLWDYTPLVPFWLGLLGISGILISLFSKKLKLLAFFLFSVLFGQIVFMSTFYTVDTRYIYTSIPILIIGIALFESFIYGFLDKKIVLKSLYFGLLFLGIFLVLFSSFTRLKYQIMLNLRHSETPWYFVSVKKMNEYFTNEKVKNNKKPYLISAMSPYFIDFYTNNNYKVLPLSQDQDFMSFKQIVWQGDPKDFSDLPALYKKLINQGDSVYVEKYGLGNVSALHRDFNKLNEDFILTEVYSGCYDLCNIYKVELRI